MAQQRRRPQAPNSIPVAAPPDDELLPEPVDVVVEAPEPSSAAIPTDVGIVETKEQPQPERRLVAVPDGIILRDGEPVTIDGMDMGQFIVVKRDVYREVYPRGTRRPSYYLLYHRGQQVLKSTLVRK